MVSPGSSGSDSGAPPSGIIIFLFEELEFSSSLDFPDFFDCLCFSNSSSCLVSMSEKSWASLAERTEFICVRTDVLSRAFFDPKTRQLPLSELSLSLTFLGKGFCTVRFGRSGLLVFLSRIFNTVNAVSEEKVDESEEEEEEEEDVDDDSVAVIIGCWKFERPDFPVLVNVGLREFTSCFDTGCVLSPFLSPKRLLLTDSVPSDRIDDTSVERERTDNLNVYSSAPLSSSLTLRWCLCCFCLRRLLFLLRVYILDGNAIGDIGEFSDDGESSSSILIPSSLLLS